MPAILRAAEGCTEPSTSRVNHPVPEDSAKTHLHSFGPCLIRHRGRPSTGFTWRQDATQGLPSPSRVGREGTPGPERFTSQRRLVRTPFGHNTFGLPAPRGRPAETPESCLLTVEAFAPSLPASCRACRSREPGQTCQTRTAPAGHVALPPRAAVGSEEPPGLT